MQQTQRRSTRRYASPLRSEQARATRRRLVQAAHDVFLASGFAGASMRAIAARAGVSVPTVEASFGTKAMALKAAIDVAIAGDDEAVPVLDRAWADEGLKAASVADLLALAAAVLASAQSRSAGLVLAVFEGSRTDAELSALATELIEQRARTATWIVDAVLDKAPLAPDLARQDAVDTVWLLMDPAVFDRLIRQRQWTPHQYELWFSRSVARILC